MENLNEKQLLLKQEIIRVGDVDIPVINDREEVWYPISYLFKKVFNRDIHADDVFRKRYKYYLSKQRIQFESNNSSVDSNIQNCNCLNREGLIIYLSRMQIIRLTLEDKIKFNKLCNILECNKIKESENVVNVYKEEWITSHDEYTQDCINDLLDKNNNIDWQMCTQCAEYYPLHNNFYYKEPRGFVSVCKNCKATGDKLGVVHSNSVLDNICKRYGVTVYKYYRDHNVIGIYEHYKSIGMCDFPKVLKNKEDYLAIIKYYYGLGFIDKDKISFKYLKDTLDLLSVNVLIKDIMEIYFYLFGNDCIYYPYRYKKMSTKDLSLEDCKIVFDNYLKDNEIIIEDIFNFPYGDTAYKARMGEKIRGDILSFIVYYYNYKYSGYKFKIQAVNYWKCKENRIRDLKYYIEEDKKISIEKIPLYVTKMALQRNALSLYYVLNSKKYYNNLFEWIDECYPDKFVVEDFEINSYRDAFDSEEEMVINEILHKEFKNVTYNQRNTQRTIMINGMIPDWLIHTDNNCWIIEHFGFYNENKDSTRSVDYKNKVDKKLETYNKMKGYKFACFYPKDLKDNCKGIYEKIKVIS